MSLLTRPSPLAAVLLLVSGCSAAQTVHSVMVGPGLEYSPRAITAAVGDRVEFRFRTGDHDVAAGPFSTPCHHNDSTSTSTSNFYSTFGPGIASNGDASFTFTVTITDARPIFFYCSVPAHCQSGMVGAINAPPSGNTLDAYALAAITAPGSTAPSSVRGGVLAPGSGGSSSSTTGTEPVANPSNVGGNGNGVVSPTSTSPASFGPHAHAEGGGQARAVACLVVAGACAVFAWFL